jgi:tRNA(Ile)-lysidine synthase
LYHLSGELFQEAPHVIRRVREYIVANELFREGARLVVAVSGGADSMALLDVLASCGMDLSLVVAHFNHRLRGAESDADAAFVREAALRYGLPLREGGDDVREICRANGWGLEEGGRNARYGFLQRVMEEEGAEGVVLGHHADDQAETVLMRLLRGAGPRGLSGMASRSGWKIRPLLALRREEIEAYLGQRSLPWHTDSSNADASYLRNRIRHRLVPSLHEYNPAVVSRLVSTAAVCAAESEVLDDLSREAFARFAHREPDTVVLRLEQLLGEKKGLRLRLYDAAIRAIKGDAAGIGAVHLLAVDDAVKSLRQHLSLSLPGLTVSRGYDSVSFRTAGGAAAPEPFEIAVRGAGTYPIPGGRSVQIGLRSFTGYDFCDGTEVFDPDAAPFPWSIRSFRNGDRINPFGMTGTKKVKDLFIELKVPLPERRRVPLLFDAGGNLLWICGLRRSAAAPVRPRTAESVVVVEFPAVTG